MAFVTKSAIILAAAAVIAFVPVVAHAQEDPKFRVSLGAGVTAGAIDGEATGNVSFGYRFSKMFSFDVEATGADGGEDRFDVLPIAAGGITTTTLGNIGVGNIGRVTNGRGGALFPGIAFPTEPGDFRVGSSSSTALTTVGIRYHIPATGTRFRPYVSGGMGVSFTENDFTVGILTTDTRNRTNSSNANTIDDSTTHTGIALTGGLGASLRVWKQLSFGVDARYYRLDRGRNLGTFGGNISYAF